jgi:hypothetical protein
MGSFMRQVKMNRIETLQGILHNQAKLVMPILDNAKKPV